MAKYYVIGKNLTPESREFLMKSFCAFVKRSEIFFCLMDKDSDLIREDILRKKPSVLVLLGAEASKEFCPKFKFISTSRGKLFDFSYKDFSCKSIVTYNPQYVNSSPGNLEEYGPTFLKDLEYSYNFVTGKLIDVNSKNLQYAKTFKEFKEYFDTYLKDAELPAYDIETNAKDPRSEAFKIIGYSLAPNGSTGIYVIRESLEYSMPTEDWQKCVELTKEYIMSRPVLVHNIMYEMPSTLNEWGVKITNFEDSLIKARLLLGGKTGAGLKEQCTRNLGYPDWDSDLHTYFSCIEELISALKPTPAGKIRDDYTVLKQLGFSGLIKYYESKDSLTAKQDSAKEAIETLKEVVLNYYSEADTYIFDLIGKEIVSLIDIQFEGVLPYSSVPLRIITKYGALDSVGTQDLNKFLSERMDKESTPDVDLWNGYRLIKENFRVGADMELNGLYWNDQKATAVKDWLDSKAYNAMISMLRSGFLDRQIFENSQDLLTDYIREKELVAVEKILGPFELQKSGIKLLATGKRITWKNLLSTLNKDFIESHYQQIVDYVKTNLENKEIFPDYEALKKFFNPSSTASKEILHSILMSKELKLASAVFEIGEEIQSGTVNIDKIPLPDRNIYTAYKNVLDYNKKIKDGEAEGDVISQKDLFKKIAYGLEYVTPKSNSLKKIIEKAASFEIDSTEESVIISVFNYMSAMGYDIEDESTWDEKFRFLIDFRTFKKCTKLISTYIEGTKVGRGSVWVVNKEELENGTELPVRKRKYSELEEGEDYLMQGTWGVCFTGDTLIKGLDGEDYSFKDLVDKGVKELWVFSIDENGDVTPSLAKEIRKTRENAELVEIKLNSGKIIRCTPSHLFLLNNGEYKEARQLTLTDNLKAFLFNDYNEIYEDKDCYVAEIKHLDYTEDVYDLTVPGYENFVLSAGPTVHNCTTNTLRWRSGVHTLPSSPMIKGVYTSRFKGGVIAAPDYSQQEIRVVSSLSNCQGLLTAYQNNEDVHMKTAMSVFHKPAEEISKNERRFCKMACRVGSSKVQLANGKIMTMEEIFEKGMKSFFVYSMNIYSKRTMFGQVVDVQQTKFVNDTVILEFEGDLTDECTLDHLYLCDDYEYREAKDLKGHKVKALQVGEKLSEVLCTNVTEKHYEEAIPVYDLSVYIFHNYSAYIGRGISVYTHNTFSILYGATAQGLANTAETSVEEAQKMIDGFFATYPEIKTWMDERHKEVSLSGKVSCPKVGYFLNIDKNGPGGLDEAYKQAGNFPVQGQASIMAGYVLSKINNYLKEHKMKTVPISFIHDSLEFDIHPLELFRTCKTIIELMNGIPKEEFNIPSKADLTIGNSMGDENTVLNIEERDDGGEIELEGFEDNLDELYNRWKEVYSSVTYEDNPDSEVDVYVPMKELFMPKLTITKYSGTHRKTIVRKFFIKF